MISKTTTVSIIGQGASGLMTARALLSRRGRNNYRVHVLEQNLGGNGTPSYQSYGFWTPQKGPLGLEALLFDSYAPLCELARQDGIGVYIKPMLDLRPEVGEPWYADKVPSFRHGRDGEYRQDHFPDAHVIQESILFEPGEFMAYLRSQVLQLGGTIVPRQVNSFAEVLGESDIVIDCAGRVSPLLADSSAAPLPAERIQVAMLQVPTDSDFDGIVFDGEAHYGVGVAVSHRSHNRGRSPYFRVGGFKDSGTTSEIDEVETPKFLERASSLVPGLHFHMGQMIKPVRCVRAAPSALKIGQDETEPRLFHNIGHKGAGLGGGLAAAEIVVNLIEALVS